MGFLQVKATAAENAIPVADAKVTVAKDGNTLHQLTTDENGNTETIRLEAPDRDSQGVQYANYDVQVSADGLVTKLYHGVSVYAGETTILPVNMTPDMAIDYIDDPARNGRVINYEGYQEIFLPEHESVLPPMDRYPESANLDNANPLLMPKVVIPLQVVVHLGRPESNASNEHVPFRDYVKNVASNELHWHWTETALETNIYCIISFVLNRIYTEWYRSRNKPFDITSETFNDQKYVHGSAVSTRMADIVDLIFNRFIRREGHKEPFFAEYCNGTTSRCPGLSQTGSESLALRGFTPIEILRYYYPNDVLINETDNMQDVAESYPGYPLSTESSGNDVRVMQSYLNRIRVNFPWQIPQIAPEDGIFGTQTYNAVKGVQSIGISSLPNTAQTGVIDRATWYRIVYLFSAVKKLGELTSEGKIVGVGRTPPTSTIRQGSTQNREIGILQYLLNFISDFYPEVQSVIMDYSFGPATAEAVKTFQMAFGLKEDGIVGRNTWAKLYEMYWKINDNIQLPPESAGSGDSSGRLITSESLPGGEGFPRQSNDRTDRLKLAMLVWLVGSRSRLRRVHDKRNRRKKR